MGSNLFPSFMRRPLKTRQTKIFLIEMPAPASIDSPQGLADKPHHPPVLISGLNRLKLTWSILPKWSKPVNTGGLKSVCKNLYEILFSHFCKCFSMSKSWISLKGLWIPTETNVSACLLQTVIVGFDPCTAMQHFNWSVLTSGLVNTYTDHFLANPDSP